MTVDLLSLRIKEAKRELTALKTAHKRGLGNVKIYTYDFNIDPTGHDTGIWELVVRVDFDSSFAAYPFVYIAPQIGQSFSYSLEVATTDYRNDGYTAFVRCIWGYENGMTKSTVVSTSPIVNVSYTWKAQ